MNKEKESFYVYETIAKKKHWYEMLQRPISIGCQPKGFVDADHTKGRHGIVAYKRKLTAKELDDFTMKIWDGPVFIGDEF